MSTITLGPRGFATRHLTLQGLWHRLSARLDAARAHLPAGVPYASGPFGQAESSLYARAYLGWRG